MFKDSYSVRTNLQKLFMQRYERYLPTAFDESHSLLEKMNALIKAQNSLVDVVNGHVDFTSKQIERAFDIIDTNIERELLEFRTHLLEQTELYEQIRDKVHSDLLPDTVRQKLEEWLLNGTVEELINDIIFSDIQEKLVVVENRGQYLDDLAVNVNMYVDPDEAVQYSYENNLNLDWGNRNYNLDQSIPNFHNIKHSGYGSITVDGTVYHLNPKEGQTNTLYVRDDGDDNNFGLSENTAFKTLQKAMNVLKARDELLSGEWVVDIGEGVFSGATIARVKSINPIIVKGVEVEGRDVPKTIISDPATNPTLGIYFSAMDVEFYDIKFKGYQRTATASGLTVNQNSNIVCYNLHAEDCNWGVTSFSSNINVRSGIFTRCGFLQTGVRQGAAIRSMQTARHHIGIQNERDRSKTVLFKDCYRGALLQEATTGHVDWCTFDNCTIGLVVNINARVNADGSKFMNSPLGLSVYNAHVMLTANSEFENMGQSFRTSGGGEVLTTTHMFKNYDPSNNQYDRVLMTEIIDDSFNITTATEIVSAELTKEYFGGTVFSIQPAKRLGFRGIVELRGNEGAKRMEFRLNDEKVGLTFTPGISQFVKFEAWIQFITPTKQVLMIEAEGNLLTVRNHIKVVETEITDDTKMRLTSSVEDGLDSMYYTHVDVMHKM